MSSVNKKTSSDDLFGTASFGGGGGGGGTDRYANAGAQYPSGYSDNTPTTGFSPSATNALTAGGAVVGGLLSGGNGYAMTAGGYIGNELGNTGNATGPSPAIPDFTAP